MPNSGKTKPKDVPVAHVGKAPRAVLFTRAMEVLNDFRHAQVGTHAANIAYFVFMSIIPLLILYVSLVPMAGISQQDLTTALCSAVPDALDDLVTTLVDEAYEKSGFAFSMSALTLLWTASQGASALRGGLNAMYDIEEDRNRLLVTIISIGYILILLATITIVLYLVFGGAIDQLVSAIVPTARMQDTLTVLFEVVLTFVVAAMLFTACYTYLAAGRRNFCMQLPGALLAAIAWSVFSLGFRVYLDHFNRFAVFYGSLGAVALFLFWMYWIFYILLVGAFINRFFSDDIGRRLPSTMVAHGVRYADPRARR